MKKILPQITQSYSYHLALVTIIKLQTTRNIKTYTIIFGPLIYGHIISSRIVIYYDILGLLI